MKKAFLIGFTMLVIMELGGCAKKCSAGCGENANPNCSAGMCDNCCAWYSGSNGCRHTEFEEKSINNNSNSNGEEEYSGENTDNIQNSSIMEILENAMLLYPSSNDLFEYNLYQRNDNEECFIEITKYIGSSTDVVVPSELDGYSVLSIGDECFRDLEVLNVELPSTLKKIGDRAFAGGPKHAISATLQKINIPEGIEVIGEEAFKSCRELQQIVLPDSLIKIGEGAFSGCQSITSVEWPEKISIIPSSVFFACNSLLQVSFPDTITEIDDYAFCESGVAGELLLPNTITRIGRDAFSNTSITSVEIPEGCIVEKEAFVTPTLVKAIIPYDVTLQNGSFGQGMENLTIYGEPSSPAAEYCSTFEIKFQLNSITE